MRGVDRAVNVTVNALQIAVTLAMALAHQKIVLEKVQAVTQTTNQLLANTSERLKTRASRFKSNKLYRWTWMCCARRSPTSIKRLRTYPPYRQEALPQMASSILEMDQMAAKAEEAIKRAELSHGASSKLTIESWTRNFRLTKS